ncbi:histone H2A acetylation [Sparganum proliferum]
MPKPAHRFEAKLIYFAEVKDKEKRKQRIDLVLSAAAEAREDIDWDTVPGVWKDPKYNSTVQDAYLNDFPYNLSINDSPTVFKDDYGLISSATQRERFSKMAASAYQKTDRSRRLCGEFCSSVRILFDALLFDYLLYPSEEKWHTPLTRHEARKGNTSSNWAATLLLPPEEIERSPSLPCLTYEAIYLLRLLVRLPTLINQMALTKCRRAIVLRHLCLFIMYLDASREYWFTNSPPSKINPLAAPVLSITPGKSSRASSSSSSFQARPKCSSSSSSKTKTRKISPKTRLRSVSVVTPKPPSQSDGDSASSALSPRAPGRQHSLRSSKVVSVEQLAVTPSPPLVRSRKRPNDDPLSVNPTKFSSGTAVDSSPNPKRARTALIRKPVNGMSLSPNPPSPRLTRSSFTQRQCQEAALSSSPASPSSEQEVPMTRTRSRSDGSGVLRRR